MAFVPQVPCHLPDTVNRDVRELLVDQQHEVKVQRRLALRRVAERRPRDRQQAALRPDREPGMASLDHPVRHCLPDQWRSNASSLPGPGLELSCQKVFGDGQLPDLGMQVTDRVLGKLGGSPSLTATLKMPAAPSSRAFFH